MRSINAVGLGVFLALLIGLLAVFGILAPVLTRFLGLELVGSTALPTSLLVFAAAFSFYFGGMAASYRAPARRRLHGTLVAVVAFAISPIINLVTGEGLFPGLDTGRAVLLAAVFLAVSVAASYVGARRGEALYAHNQRLIRRGRL
jgi:predicted ABC-type exoprotein transport system permease subunit